MNAITKNPSLKRLGFFATRDLTFSNYLGGEYLQSSLAFILTAYSQVVHFFLKYLKLFFNDKS